MKHELTPGVERAAAQRGVGGRLRLPVVGLHDDLVALHQPLTDELLKHLNRTHHRSFIFTPGNTSTLILIIWTGKLMTRITFYS